MLAVGLYLGFLTVANLLVFIAISCLVFGAFKN